MSAEYNIKLHLAKWILLTEEIRWSGRLISAQGVRYDQRRLDSILTMEPPTNGGHLQQFLCALKWLKQCIPNSKKLVATLHDFMERIYSLIVKRTKRAVARFLLSNHSWGPNELQIFEACKRGLANQVTMSHHDHTQRLCVYTDASDMAWSGILTEVPETDGSKPNKAAPSLTDGIPIRSVQQDRDALVRSADRILCSHEHS